MSATTAGQIITPKQVIQFTTAAITAAYSQKLSKQEIKLACARMMRSMLALQPNLEATTTAGESVRRLVTETFSTLSPSTCN